MCLFSLVVKLRRRQERLKADVHRYLEEVGAVSRRSGAEMAILAEVVLEGLALGDSVAVDGVCLTVAAITEKGFVVQVSPESFSRTTLGGLHVGHAVNLERAMQPTTAPYCNQGRRVSRPVQFSRAPPYPKRRCTLNHCACVHMRAYGPCACTHVYQACRYVLRLTFQTGV